MEERASDFCEAAKVVWSSREGDKERSSWRESCLSYEKSVLLLKYIL